MTTQNPNTENQNMNAEQEFMAKITNYSIGTAINALSRAHGDAKGIGDGEAVRKLRLEIANAMLALESIEATIDDMMGADE